jgi:hypothetical protein
MALRYWTSNNRFRNNKYNRLNVTKTSIEARIAAAVVVSVNNVEPMYLLLADKTDFNVNLINDKMQTQEEQLGFISDCHSRGTGCSFG